MVSAIETRSVTVFSTSEVLQVLKRLLLCDFASDGEGHAKQIVFITESPQDVVAVANSVRAQLLLPSFGDIVGYKIPNQRRQGARHPLLLCIPASLFLWNYLYHDPLLSSVTVIVIVAIESLEIDVILGLLKRLLQLRRSLRVVCYAPDEGHHRIIDFFRPSAWDNKIPLQAKRPRWDEAPRLKPLAFIGRENFESITLLQPTAKFECRPDAIRSAVYKAHSLLETSCSSNILIIHPIVSQFEGWSDMLQMDFHVATIHGGMSDTEAKQHLAKCLNGKKQRLVVISDEAKVSLVKNVGAVIDTGLTHEHMIHPVEDVLINFVSPAALPTLIRRQAKLTLWIWPRSDNEALSKEELPSGFTSGLAHILLFLLSVGGTQVLQELELPTPWPTKAVATAFEELLACEAVNDLGRLTKFGEDMATLSLAPPLARALLLGIRREFNCIAHEIAVIVAMLLHTENDDWLLPGTSRNLWRLQRAARQSLQLREGDFLTLYNVYQLWCNNNADWAKRHFINVAAMKRVQKTVRKLHDWLDKRDDCCSRLVEGPDLAESLLNALSAAFIFNMAVLRPDGSYHLMRTKAKRIKMQPDEVMSVYGSTGLQWPPYIIFHGIHSNRKGDIKLRYISPVSKIPIVPSFH